MALRKILATVLLLLVPTLALAGSFSIFQAAAVSSGSSFQVLPVGGGGFVTGLQIYSNGAQVAKTDTAGAFYRSSHTNKWTPVVTSASMPSGANSVGSLEGACAIAAAPSDTTHLYLYYANYADYDVGYVYVSTNGGASWTVTGFGPVDCDPNDSGSVSWRLKNYAMQVSPANEDVVYLGTPGNGVYYSLNGGSSWTQISTGTIPAGTTPSGATQGQGNLIYFDPSDDTGNTVYISAYGTGIYKCTSATTSPSCTELSSSGMPTTFSFVFVDQDGTLWVVDNEGDAEGSLYRYLSSTWSKQVSPSDGNYVASVAVNPSNASEVYAVDYHGYINYSTNGQAATPTWSGYLTTVSLSSSSIPWISWSGTSGLVMYPSGFDPSQTNVLYIGTGVGVANTTPPTSGTPTVTWNFNETEGIENLVVESVIPLAAGGFVSSAWDRPLWILGNSGSYPSQYYPNAAGVVRGYTACVNGDNIGIVDSSGLNVSTNSGSSWSGYAANGDAVGGTCALLTSTNWIWNAWDYSGATTYGLYFTSNSGSSFSECTFNNSAVAQDPGWGGNFGLDPIPNYLAFDPTGGITLQFNDGSGANTAGIYKLTSTSSCAFTYVGSAPINNNTPMLINVPGESGNFFMGTVVDPQDSLPVSSSLLYITKNSGTSWTQIADVESLFAFGFGAALSGSDGYPTLYCACYVNTGSGYVYGIWQAENIDSGSPVWTKLGNGFPNNTLDLIVGISGDLQTPGIVYGALGGYGGGTGWFFYGPQLYLLNRDLDPASNDNSPVGLDKVA